MNLPTSAFRVIRAGADEIAEARRAYYEPGARQRQRCASFDFDQLLELFKRDCLNFHDIGGMGTPPLSRERVRQIYRAHFAKLFGRTGGRQRRRLCKLKRAATALHEPPQPGTPLRFAWDDALAHGLAVRRYPTATRKLHSRIMVVDGVVCGIRIASHTTAAHHGLYHLTVPPPRLRQAIIAWVIGGGQQREIVVVASSVLPPGMRGLWHRPAWFPPATVCPGKVAQHGIKTARRVSAWGSAMAGASDTARRRRAA